MSQMPRFGHNDHAMPCHAIPCHSRQILFRALLKGANSFQDFTGLLCTHSLPVGTKCPIYPLKGRGVCSMDCWSHGRGSNTNVTHSVCVHGNVFFLLCFFVSVSLLACLWFASILYQIGTETTNSEHPLLTKERKGKDLDLGIPVNL